MTTREQKLITLVNTLGYAEALRLAPSLTDDATGGDSAADKAAADAAAVANAATKNPFIKGEHFSLAEQGRLYKNPKTRSLAISLAAKAGLKLSDTPLQNDLNAYFAPVHHA